SNMRQHMMNLLREAHPDDAIHDVEFQVGPTLRTFPAHRFMIIVSQRTAGQDGIRVFRRGEGSEGVTRRGLWYRSSLSHPFSWANTMLHVVFSVCLCPDIAVCLDNPCYYRRIVPVDGTRRHEHEVRVERIPGLIPGALCESMSGMRIPKSNNIKTSLTKNDDMLDNERNLESLSAFAVYSAESARKKVKSKQKKVSAVKSPDEENVCSVCDPVRLAQEAAKKFGLSTLHKKLEGVRYANFDLIFLET
ncbi:unnamed protein product, partial [Timema podura]|nr:unnamed protein product [Timema podura]